MQLNPACPCPSTSNIVDLMSPIIRFPYKSTHHGAYDNEERITVRCTCVG